MHFYFLYLKNNGTFFESNNHFFFLLKFLKFFFIYFMNNIRTFAKVVFIGDSGVGKSCIISRFSTGNIPIESLPTVGAAYYSKIITIENSEIELRIWDTAGQETYQSLTPIYFRNALIAFVVYDVTKKETFLSVKNWVNQLKDYCNNDIVIVIVGNKIDLENEKKIDFSELSLLSEELKALAIETSALNGYGIDRMIQIGLSALLELNPSIRRQLTFKEPKQINQIINKNSICC